MNEEVQSLRKRLQDLHEQHVTGFVNDAQYAEARALLERKLVDAVMRSPDPDEEWPETVMMGDMRPDAALLPPVPMPSTGAKSSALRWLIGTGLLAVAAAALTYGWAVSSSRSAATPSRPTASVDRASAPTAAVIVDAATSSGQPAAPAGSSISGTVDLSPTLAPQAKPNDTVFIFARAVEGPPVPLAVIRKQVKDLPLQFTLDDSMAMWPDAKVSAFSRVVVTARVSKSGEGQARPGDLEGHSAPVAVGAAGLQIAIANVVGP
ncbi:hypothetical protein [Piscinibacter sp. HJYY11]|uniref:c-type cytochrome biogenesis protein CcmI/CycH n=1 Tax=Piscinibacter sp. HJYY11 TaxID=2801333 RepID=UPI00191C99DD|nr:hypothetical protein [Piscinibacter sp. HJYY11]MBL0727845.1 hypothetical protein [Piscinibacter sp. HJYY11]